MVAQPISPKSNSAAINRLGSRGPRPLSIVSPTSAVIIVATAGVDRLVAPGIGSLCDRGGEKAPGVAAGMGGRKPVHPPLVEPNGPGTLLLEQLDEIATPGDLFGVEALDMETMRRVGEISDGAGHELADRPRMAAVPPEASVRDTIASLPQETPAGGVSSAGEVTPLSQPRLSLQA